MFPHKICLGLAVCAGATVTQGTEWQQDFGTAKAQAQAENKAILLFFTGSDWCGWCVRMHSSILSSQDFTQYAQDKFVPVIIDMPRNKSKQPLALQEQNQALVTKYGITQYPSVLVLSPDETVLGGFIGGRDMLEHVIAPLDAALLLQQQTQAAEALSGEEKARALLAIYSKLPHTLRPYFRPMRDAIADADPHNTTGIHTEIADTAQLEQLQQTIRSGSQDFHAVLNTLQQAYKQASAPNKLKIRQLQLQYLEQTQNNIILSANSIEDVYTLKRVLQEIIKLSSPEDAKTLQQEIDTMFCNPQEVLNMLKTKQQGK